MEKIKFFFSGWVLLVFFQDWTGKCAFFATDTDFFLIKTLIHKVLWTNFGHFKDCIFIFCLVAMKKNSRYVISICNNDKRYPQHHVKYSNVKGNIMIHPLPKEETVRKT